MKWQNVINWQWVALIVGLLTAVPVHAFYNPQTGYWANRDPLGNLNPLLEESGTESLPTVSIDEANIDSFDPYRFVASSIQRASANLFGFVSNNPLSSYDLFGLAEIQDPPPSGTLPGGSFVIKNVTITHYCNCKKCTNKSPGGPGYGQTADGTTACQGTVATDWSKIPKGATVTWTDPDGSQVTGVVHDKGGAIKGDHIDAWCKSHQDAVNKGKYQADVTVTLP